MTISRIGNLEVQDKWGKYSSGSTNNSRNVWIDSTENVNNFIYMVKNNLVKAIMGFTFSSYRR